MCTFVNIELFGELSDLPMTSADIHAQANVKAACGSSTIGWCSSKTSNNIKSIQDNYSKLKYVHGAWKWQIKYNWKDMGGKKKQVKFTLKWINSWTGPLTYLLAHHWHLAGVSKTSNYIKLTNFTIFSIKKIPDVTVFNNS